MNATNGRAGHTGHLGEAKRPVFFYKWGGISICSNKYQCLFTFVKEFGSVKIGNLVKHISGDGSLVDGPAGVHTFIHLEQLLAIQDV
jgi:hypothetical protein